VIEQAAPRARDRRPAPRRRPARPPRETALPPLILIVDDLLDQRELYAGYLRHVGFRVEEAAGGVDGIARAIELRPDLVLMDLAMPGLDGFHATRVLKAVALTSTIPVLALTAHGDHLPPEWASIAGCDAYLRKPILPADLATHIRRMLARRRS
jgi:CheY-like chemotaxis protein